MHCQFAFFDLCAGNRHQIMLYARVEAVNVMLQLWIVWVEVAKVVQGIGLSLKCGTNYMLFCSLLHVHVEPVKTVSEIGHSPRFGVCVGGNSVNGTGNIFPVHNKECNLGGLLI